MLLRAHTPITYLEADFKEVCKNIFNDGLCYGGNHKTTSLLGNEREKYMKQIIKKLPWMKNISEETINIISNSLEKMNLDQKEVIKNQGESIDKLIYVISGKLFKMTMKTQNQTNEASTSNIFNSTNNIERIETYTENDIIGHLELFDNNHNVYEPCHLKFKIAQEDLIVSHPDICDSQVICIKHEEIKQLLSAEMLEFIQRYVFRLPLIKFLNFGKVKILRVLGKGAFGQVYLIRSNKELLALKVVSHQFLLQSHTAQFYFREELSNLSLINSPFVVRFKGYDYDNTNCYLLMSYSSSVSLKKSYDLKIISSNPSTLLFYLNNLIIALELLHLNGILHRDIKPENIILQPNGYLEIIDFGLSKKIKGFTSTIVGSPYFMSPEIIQGKGYGKSTDYWSLAITMYELLIGKSPFVGDHDHNVIAIYQKILNKEVSFPQASMSSFAQTDFGSKLFDSNYKKLKNILSGMMKKDIKQRITISKIKEMLSDQWTKVNDMTHLSPKIDTKVFNANNKEENLKIFKTLSYKDLTNDKEEGSACKEKKINLKQNTLYNKWLEDNKNLY